MKRKSIQMEIYIFAPVLKKLFSLSFSLFLLLAMTVVLPIKAERVDTLHTVEVVAPLSRDVRLESLCPVAHTTVGMPQVEQLRVMDVKDLSALVPSLHIPDYGSRMTSTVYVRGLGSRIDQPALGIYINGVPLLNKNTYDFPLADIRSIAVLRGPQNTLYGRNAMGGVVDIKTLSPLSYQGLRLMLEGGSGTSFRSRASLYSLLKPHLGLAAMVQATTSEGFFTNTHKDSKCDWSRTLQGELRLEGNHNGTHWQATAAADWVNQGGFPYRLLDSENVLQPIRYNDICAYNRLILRTAFTLDGDMGSQRYASSTSYQYSSDCMRMDQDFTPRAMFTLEQAQRDHTINQDFTLRPIQTSRWQPLHGLNLWYRHLHTAAPVVFRADGIQQLILDNANKGIQMLCPNDTLQIAENTLPILSQFTQQYYGAALYHHSAMQLASQWQLSMGMRAEYEGQHFAYHSHTEVPYHISSPDGNIDATAAPNIQGSRSAHYFEFAPKLGLTHTLPLANSSALTSHISAARGFKAGGFNTQLFSDLVRQMLSNHILAHYVSVSPPFDVEQTTRYRPEHSWNLDAGLKYTRPNHRATFSTYYTDCRNQQLTVFPPGLQTGRMMTNAGHSRIWGLELEGEHHLGQFSLQYAYGYTHARFVDYPDGMANYRGRTIPYIPQHTYLLGLNWRKPLGGLWSLALHADARGAGPLYWDEQNQTREPAYVQLNASAKIARQQVALTLWGKNLTNQTYSTFYFVSMQNRFLQQGKPLHWGATLSYTL